MKFSKSALARINAGLLPLLTEDAVQKQIVQGLRLHGYLVLVTTRRPKRCQCGLWPRSGGGDGSSRGVGDLLAQSLPGGLDPDLWQTGCAREIMTTQSILLLWCGARPGRRAGGWRWK
jgi:hypothetical protein